MGYREGQSRERPYHWHKPRYQILDLVLAQDIVKSRSRLQQ